MANLETEQSLATDDICQMFSDSLRGNIAKPMALVEILSSLVSMDISVELKSGAKLIPVTLWAVIPKGEDFCLALIDHNKGLYLIGWDAISSIYVNDYTREHTPHFTNLIHQFSQAIDDGVLKQK